MDALHSGELQKTALCGVHERLRARLAPFGGWLMPIQYEGILAEHHWTRTACSVFDVGHMGEFRIRGSENRRRLDQAVTVNLEKLAVGACRYGFLLNEQGGILDDVIVYALAADDLMLVVNAATALDDAAHLRNYLTAADFEDVSARTGKLDVQGPAARDVLQHCTSVDVRSLSYYQCAMLPVLGKNIIVSRTGYTGEQGYELYIPAEDLEFFWTALLRDARVKPAGLGCRDTLRLEMGYPLYGQDIDRSTTPLEAGFERFLDMSKEFIGKKALQAQLRQGISRRLAGFVSPGRRSPRHHYGLYAGDEKIGTVTSGSFSPSLVCAIGMGYVRPAESQNGTRLSCREGAVDIEVTVCPRPFYQRGTARA
ncbi:MAG: glycine cleavage system aminomethyltransferase GcvT [Candidatus Omnitrophica bacterium]|nr:glycine cleavage system aminomethyltransferase GcvT [Candidatus Omnitrophota bacterium]